MTALEKKLYFLKSPRNLELLEKSLSDQLGEQLGASLRLVFILGDGRKVDDAPAPTPNSNAAPTKPAPPAPNVSQDAFLNDPVIQNALKIFEAKIVSPASP